MLSAQLINIPLWSKEVVVPVFCELLLFELLVLLTGSVTSLDGVMTSISNVSSKSLEQ